MPILVDTNVLLRVRDVSDPNHAACLQLLNPPYAARHQFCICAQVMIEYWSSATRPAAQNGMGLSPAEARADLDRFCRFLPRLSELPDMDDRWTDVVSTYGVIGKQAHDARLIALMAGHAVQTLVTINLADFQRYRGTTAVSPAQFIARNP